MCLSVRSCPAEDGFDEGFSQLEDEVQTDLQRATGLADTSDADSTGLNRILQFTGRLSHPQSSVKVLVRLTLLAVHLAATKFCHC